MATVKQPPSIMDLQAKYDFDFYAWLNQNVELLRDGRQARN